MTFDETVSLAQRVSAETGVPLLCVSESFDGRSRERFQVAFSDTRRPGRPARFFVYPGIPWTEPMWEEQMRGFLRELVAIA